MSPCYAFHRGYRDAILGLPQQEFSPEYLRGYEAGQW